MEGQRDVYWCKRMDDRKKVKKRKMATVVNGPALAAVSCERRIVKLFILTC